MRVVVASLCENRTCCLFVLLECLSLEKNCGGGYKKIKKKFKQQKNTRLTLILQDANTK